MQSIYRDLIRPIPAKLSLANVADCSPATTCHICRAIVPDRATAKNNAIQTTYERIDEYPDFPELKAAARAGCGLCWIVRKALRQNWAIRPMEEWGVGPLSADDDEFVDLLETSWDRKVRIYNCVLHFDPLGDRQELDGPQCGGMVTGMTLEFGPAYVATTALGEPMHSRISQVIAFKVFDSLDLEVSGPRKLPSPDTLSDENLIMIESWVAHCKSDHAVCRLPTVQGLWLPTRLLDVGSDSAEPRVVETEMLGNNDVTYAALSHMWGDVEAGPPLRTTTFNYDEMTRAIPLSSLPRNFADAVETCRRLDIPYVWIDSLCIKQNSPEDWQQEALEMHRVYTNAEITIVATSATSSHDGFLARDLSAVTAAKVEYRLPGASVHFLVLTPLGDHEAGLRRGDIDGARWNTRGWTMQERSLSTRLVHFCRNKIYYECRGCLQSEEGEPERIEAFGSFKMLPRSCNEPAEWYEHWRSAVIGYSQRRLTVATDKLTAIGSLANEMKMHLPDLYAYGMWLSRLKLDVLWYVERGVPNDTRDARAPSWSWAALDVGIGFSKGSLTPRLAEGHISPWPRECSFSLPLRSTDPSSRRLRVEGHIVFLDAVRRPENSSRVRDRPSFQYNVIRTNNQGDEVVCAHATLDLDGRDGSLSSNYSLAYVHVTDKQHPTGLLLRQDSNRSRWKFHSPWERIGVATICYTSGELIDQQIEYSSHTLDIL